MTVTPTRLSDPSSPFLLEVLDTGVGRRRESVSSTVSRTERAVSAPPQTTTVSPKKQVKFVKRSVSEPTKSSVEEELGLLGKLRLAKEVKKDTIGRLRDDC